MFTIEEASKITDIEIQRKGNVTEFKKYFSKTKALEIKFVGDTLNDISLNYIILYSNDPWFKQHKVITRKEKYRFIIKSSMMSDDPELDLIKIYKSGMYIKHFCSCVFGDEDGYYTILDTNAMINLIENILSSIV